MHQTEQNIIVTVILITSVFLIAGVFLLFYVRLYNERKRNHEEEKLVMKQEFDTQILHAQIEVQEATFATLGGELHDNIGQLLSTTKMLLGLTERTLSPVPDTLLTATTTLGKAIHELRALSKSMTREWLEQFDFVDNLRTETQRLNTDDRLRVELTCLPRIPMTADKQILLFRIVQEAIQNVIKHSGANHLVMDVTQDGDRLHVSLTDNGSGFAETGNRNGIGLLNMKQRVRLLGGEIEWQSPPAGGTRVFINLPLEKTMYEDQDRTD
ncbi:MAG: hypothetical protein EOO05_13050 [Chitinophagaceae bacterium]|nr:MAG: hypothetical protein EOO05_13050 [Chitinophagaceae bacterium]